VNAYVIYIPGNSYSEECAERCVKSGAAYGVDVQRFGGVTQDEAQDLLDEMGLIWSWPWSGSSKCARTGLVRTAYRTKNMGARIGCSLSHFLLWRLCQIEGAPIIILEHDAVFINPLPELMPTFGAVMLNDPKGATPRGDWWSNHIAERGPGVWPKTAVFADGRPDGLAGNSAYVISPEAAARCMQLYHDNGVWPNDATLCRQLVPDLMEVYPFVTEARQTQSTSGGY